MLYFQIKVQIRFLWKNRVFKKKAWNSVNLIVGPNGSGKTLLAERIFEQLKALRFSPVLMRTDRFISDNRELPQEALELLYKDAAVKARVEQVVSCMLQKDIRLINDGGRFISVIKDAGDNTQEYNVRDAECHGLKEIIMLLIALYDDRCDCLIIDEPELHLHPQLQLFLTAEIRRLAGNPRKEAGKKIFFLVTHSPYFIDLRSPDDLKGVILCHNGSIPSCIEQIDSETEALVKRFLPRFNAHHKQLFFSDNSIFVEGYTDQQIMSILLDWLPLRIEYAGAGIIDVGGKDELGVFYNICRILGAEARVIADLDSLFRGKLRDVLCRDARIDEWLKTHIAARQKQKLAPYLTRAETKNVTTQNEPNGAKQIDFTLRNLLSALENILISFGAALRYSYPDDENLASFCARVRYFYNNRNRVEDLDTFKTVLLQGLTIHGRTLLPLLSKNQNGKLDAALELRDLIIAAAESVKIFILSRGCIEHYYTQSNAEYMPITGKDKLFHKERDHLLQLDADGVFKEYAPLIDILKKII